MVNVRIDSVNNLIQNSHFDIATNSKNGLEYISQFRTIEGRCKVSMAWSNSLEIDMAGNLGLKITCKIENLPISVTQPNPSKIKIVAHGSVLNIPIKVTAVSTAVDVTISTSIEMMVSFSLSDNRTIIANWLTETNVAIGPNGSFYKSTARYVPTAKMHVQFLIMHGDFA